jgi:NAD-dependent DNA ligase
MSSGYNTLDKIQNITELELLAIKGMGAEKIKALLDGLEANKPIIAELEKLGVSPMADVVQKKDVSMFANKLTGKSICITGKTMIKRDELAKMIERASGKFHKKVDKTTTHLVMTKEDSETKKALAAKANGTTIISEQELLAMMAVDQ